MRGCGERVRRPTPIPAHRRRRSHDRDHPALARGAARPAARAGHGDRAGPGHVAALTGAVIGAYDGNAGPGTGAFLVFALVGLLGFALLEAGATPRSSTRPTNIGVLVVFAIDGSVLWMLGLAMGAADLTGG